MHHTISLIEQYLKYLLEDRHFSMSTCRAYRSDLYDFSRFEETGAGHHHRILSADETRLMRYLASLKERHLAPSTIARKVAALHTFYAWLSKMKLIEHNPATTVKRPPMPRRTIKLPDDAHVSVFIAAIDDRTVLGKRDRAITLVIHTVGVRLSELLALKKNDVNFDTSPPMMNIRNRAGAVVRQVELTTEATTAIKAYLAATSDKALDPTTAPLFPNNLGGHLSTRSMRRKMDDYLNKIGANFRVSPTMLRHACAQGLLKKGVGVQKACQQLGMLSDSSLRLGARQRREAEQRACKVTQSIV